MAGTPSEPQSSPHFPSQSQPHDPDNRSRHTRPSTEQSELSWLEFLRTAGGTVPDTTPTAPTPAAQTQQTSIVQRDLSTDDGSSQVQARRGRQAEEMDAVREWTSQGPPPPLSSGFGPPGYFSALNDSTRRESETSLPRWQPDAEVTECPVCNTEFTFWYRKHHCRKCGRVVCTACSPHRITIPRQYVVRAPSSIDAESGLPNMNASLAANLGGGEVVRVCNPCVPDPWTPNAGSTAHGGSTGSNTGDAHSRADETQHHPVTAPGPGPGYPIPNPPAFRQRPTRHQPIFPSGQTSIGRARAHSHQVAPTFSRSVPHPGIPHDVRLQVSPPVAGARTPSSNVRRHRYTSSTNSYLGRHGGQSGTTAASSDHPLPPPPRRRIREEDECPVCGRELPLGDAVREAHIEACVTSRFSSPQPGATSIGELPASPRADAAQGVRVRGTSFRSRGMAVYRATEKDCATESGDPQECIICFEDFQPGDEMGRMECLCKFHRVCIRQWWQTKGPGSCPTHQLQE